MPPRSSWPQLHEDGEEFRRVAFPAEFLDGEEALVYTAGSPLRPDVKGPGYWVFAPARLAGGSIVLVNRGFVPADRKDPGSAPKARRTALSMSSVCCAGPRRAIPSRRPTIRKKMSGFCAIRIRSPISRNGRPQRHSILIRKSRRRPAAGQNRASSKSHLPDDHLQYAITWFGLALALAGVYIVWLARRLVGEH